MKRTIFLIAAVAGIVCGSHAASRLKVTLTDGTTPTFVLADKPVVTFPVRTWLSPLQRQLWNLTEAGW